MSVGTLDVNKFIEMNVKKCLRGKKFQVTDELWWVCELCKSRKTHFFPFQRCNRIFSKSVCSLSGEKLFRHQNGLQEDGCVWA